MGAALTSLSHSGGLSPSINPEETGAGPQGPRCANPEARLGQGRAPGRALLRGSHGSESGLQGSEDMLATISLFLSFLVELMFMFRMSHWFPPVERQSAL